MKNFAPTSFKFLLLFVCLIGILGKANAANYNTTAAGSWFSASSWSGGLPGSTLPSSSIIKVNHPTTLDNSGGTINFSSSNTELYVNASLIDISTNGWSIAIGTGGGNKLQLNSNFYFQGGLDIQNSNTVTVAGNGYFGGTLYIESSGGSSVILKSGYTLTVGSLTLGGSLTVEPGATLVVLGNANILSSSPSFVDNGNIIVYGNYTTTWSAQITGSGTLNVSGSASQPNGASLIFGQSGSCSSNCSYNDPSQNPTCSGLSASVAAAQSICTGSAPSQLTSTVTGNVTYQWQSYSSNTYSSVSGGTGATTASYTPPSLSSTTIYRLKITTTPGSCFIYSSPVTISVSSTSPTNSSGLVYGPNPICLNSSGTFNYSITGITNATSYSWTVPSGFSLISSSSNVAVISVSGVQTGTISVAGINSCGRSSVTTFAVTTISSAPTSFTVSSITGSSFSFCDGTQQVFSISGVSNVYTYNWTLPSGFSIYNSSGTGFGTTGNIIYVNTSGSTSGNIAVAATNTCGSNTSVTKSVAVNSLVGGTGSIIGSAVVCGNSNASYVYSVSGITNATSGYGWTISGTNSSKNGLNSAYTATNTFTGSATSTLYVKSTLSSGATILMSVAGWNTCGIGSASVITITSTNTSSGGAGTITGASPVCQGTSNTYTISGFSNVGAYNWTVPSGFTITSTNGTSSNTVTVSVSGTSTATISVSGTGCGLTTVTSKSISISSGVSGTPVITGSNSICINSSSSLFTVTGVSSITGYVWSIPSGMSIVSGQNSSVLGISTTSVSGTGIISVTGTNACSSSALATYTVTSSNRWLGISSDWSNSANWCGTIVSGITMDVVIPSGVTKMPLLSTAGISVRDITINSGASLSITGTNQLSVAGNWSNSGTFVANSSTVVFSGSTVQTISGNSNTAFSNITIYNSVSGVVLGSGEFVSNTMTLGNAAIFNSNGNLTIISNSVTGTGRIAAIPTNAVFSGNINMQRFSPAKRAYRFYSSAVSGGTLAQLQNNMYVTGTGGASNGFDASTYNLQTVYWYNENVPGPLNSGWASPSSIGTTLTVGAGYQIFIRGDRTVNVNSTIPSSTTTGTTLQVTGTINRGNITLPVSFTTSTFGTTADGWNLVGNPYPSEIDWNSANWTKTNIDNAIYIWDPLTTNTVSTSTVGIYFTYINGVSSPARTNPNIISSSQGFFVHANAASPSLIVTENAKVSSSPTSYFRQEKPTNLLRIQVSKAAQFDETVLRFTNAATHSFDKEYDAVKLQNSALNINSRSRDNIAMVISAMPLPDTAGYEVPVEIAATQKGTYGINFEGQDAFDFSARFYLRDKYLNTLTAITPGTIYSFEVTTDAATSGSRFAIITKKIATEATPAVNVPGADTLIFITTQPGEGIILNDSTNTTGTIVQEATTQQSDSATGTTGNVIITPGNKTDKSDSITYTNTATAITPEANSSTINVYPNPFEQSYLNIDLPATVAQGKVEITFYTTGGDKVWEKSLSAGTLGEKIEVQIEGSHFSPGVYIVKVTGNGTTHYVKVIKQ